MNKNRYRIIFSQARGMFIAVAEIVKSKTKAAGQTILAGDGDSEPTASLTLNTYKRLNPINFAVISLLGAAIYTLPMASIAGSQIVADKSAPNSQQATILNTSNGLTQVNIQTPSAGGVSRNTYTQFDVGQEGAVLNNSRNNVQTQIGGWVQGNPWLAKGEAKVILNEVNSSNPSQLKGYLEVAGKQAQVVIANPSGLVCDGCGVINADRFTLTTGQAVMNQGYLESFRVREGQVTIEGKGLNGSMTPYTDIYARALNINAGLYANELKTILGQNDINLQDPSAPQITKATTSGTATIQTAPQPSYALDVGQLGGMYAGKIYLIGTENGLGVRNAGSINTTAAQMTLNANGDLVNTGNIIANKDQIAIQAQNVQNSGNISSTQSKIQVDATDIQNSGLIATSDELKLNAHGNINNNNGVINAGRLDLTAQSLSNNTGKIEQTGQQQLNITAKNLDNTQGLIGQATQENSAGTGSSTGGTTTPTVTDPEQNSSAQDASTVTVAPTESSAPKTFAAGNIQIAQNIQNIAGQLVNNADINLKVQDSIKNNGGEIQLPELQFNGQNFENQAGKLTAKVINITAQNADNQKGLIDATESFDLNAQQLKNNEGRLQSAKALNVTSAQIDNSKGQILATDSLTLGSEQTNNTEGVIGSVNADAQLNIKALNNNKGEISAQNVQLTGQTLNNQQGSIQAKTGDLALKVDQIDNGRAQDSAGNFTASKNLSITAQQLNSTGQIYAGDTADLTVKQLQQDGQLAALNKIKVQSDNITSKKNAIWAAGLDSEGKLSQSDATLNIDAQQAQIAGTVLSGESVAIHATQNADLSQSATQAKNIKINTQELNTSNAKIIADQQLDLIGKQSINNQQGQYSAVQVNIDTAQLNNDQGLIQHTGQNDFILNVANRIDNNAGKIISNANNTEIKTANLSSVAGEILHAGDQQLKITAQNLQGQQGKIQSNQNLQLELGTAHLDNATTAAENINLNATTLSHKQGQLIQSDANGQLNVNVAQALDNTSGVISAAGQATLNTADLNNQQGVIQTLADKDLKITSQKLDNQSGKIIAGRDANLQVSELNNDQGTVYADGKLDLQATQDVRNQQGLIASQQALSIKGQNLNNQNGQIQSEQSDVHLNLTQSINNQSGRIQSAQALNIQSPHLENKNGQLVSGTESQINVAQLNNQAGTIYSKKQLDVTVSGTADNSAGTIAAEQNLNLNAQQLLNDAGQIRSENADTVLNVTQDISNNTGLISADKDLTLNAQNVHSQKGKLQSGANATVQVNSIDNSEGVIYAAEQLQLNATGELNNRKGVVAAEQLVDLKAGSVMNDAGQIRSQQDQLKLNVQNELSNLAGEISAEKAIELTANKLLNNQNGKVIAGLSLKATTQQIDNNTGTIYAKDQLNLNVADRLNNQSGTIAANQQVQIQANSLNNNAGKIRSEQNQLDLNVKQTLDNQSGEIFAGTHANINATTLNNQQGTIYAKNQLDLKAGQLNNQQGQVYSEGLANVTVQGDVQNQKGVIVAGQNLTLQSQNLDNTEGSLRSEKADLTLNTQGQLINQQGDIYAGQNANLNTQSLINNAGQIASQKQLKIDTQQQQLSNQNGKIIAKVVDLKTGTLDNQAGLIQGEQSVKVDTQNHALLNNNSGDQAGILSQGSLEIANVSQLDNISGYIAAVGSTNITAQNLNNNKGQINSQADLSIQQQALGGRIDNLAGQIQAQKNLNLNTDTINNSGVGSHLVAGEKLTANTTQLINSQTKDATTLGGIDAKNIELNAQELDNQSGAIRASENATLNIQNQLSNQSGSISSLDTLNIGTSNKTLNVNNTGGELLAKNQLNLKANELINKGKIISEGNIDIDLKQSYTHTKDDQIAANGTLKLSTEKNLINQSELTAGQKIELNAQNIDNQSGATISSNETHLTAQDTVHNQGLINGELTHIQANRVWNDGARIYGTQVSIQANTLDNKSNTAGTGAVIASRGDMDLGIGTLNNQSGGEVKLDARDNAWIFSAGNLNVGGSLDGDLKAQGSANKIYNGSATIESLGNMTLVSNSILNNNERFNASVHEVSRKEIHTYEINGKVYDAKDIIIHKGDRSLLDFETPSDGTYQDAIETKYTEVTKLKQIDDSVTGQILAGNNLSIESQDIRNEQSQMLAGQVFDSKGVDVKHTEVEGYQLVTAKNTTKIRHYRVKRSTGPFNSNHKMFGETENLAFSVPEVTTHPDIDVSEHGGNKTITNKQASITDTQKSTENLDLDSVSETSITLRNQQASNNSIKTDSGEQISADTNNTYKSDKTNDLKINNSTINNIDAEQRNANQLDDAQQLQLDPQNLYVQNNQTQTEIRTVNQEYLTLPSNALYITTANSQAKYFVETDPAFSNYKNWLSSDYMLNALGLDPAMQQKRIGDGYYEQRLVQDQIAQLTGYRFLEGYGSDEDQYQALMNNGLTFAKLYNLRPGIALTDAQIAQLTTDIVWLEEKTIKLANGTTTKALVPQVYVRARVGDLKGDGSLISANKVNIQMSGDVLNSATIAGREVVSISANNINQLNGRIESNQLALKTQKDLNNIGGTISAKTSAILDIGGDFNHRSTIYDAQNIEGENAFIRQGIDRKAALYVGSPLNVNSTNTEHLTTTLTIRVGGDVRLDAADISNNNGNTDLQAAGHLSLNAVTNRQLDQSVNNADNYHKREEVRDIGSLITGLGNVNLNANQISGKAVNIESKTGDLALVAQNGITLENGESRTSVDQGLSIKTKALIGNKTEKTKEQWNTSESIANQLKAGGNITLDTQQGDITATHLKAQAEENIQIHAQQGNVTLNSAIDENSHSSTSEKKNFATYNNRQTGYINQEVAQTQLTAGKNVDINAGKNIELQANDVKAGQNIYVGNTLMQRQADGTLKAADGSLMPENVKLSTVETHDQQWDEQQSGYRGVFKELVKVAEVGLAGVKSLFPGVNVDTKLTVGETSSQRDEQIKQTGTNLTADNVYVGSSGQTTLTSAEISAKNTVISGQKVTLDSAEEQNITAQSHSKESIEGLGVKLNKDNIRLGGFISEDASQSSKTTETTHKTGSIQTENLKIQGAEGIDILGQNIKATGDTVLDHGRGDLNIGGYENKTTVEDKTHKETISAEVGVRNAYLDAALAVGAVKDAAEAVKQAKDQYSQAQRDYASGKITKEALDDTKANVAMATANLANAQIAVGAAAASAAASSATYGFTIGANGERTETTTSTNTTQGKWQGSQLDLNNLTLKSENQDVNLQGSSLTATGTTTFDGTKDFNVTAGTEHGQQESNSKTNNQSVSYTSGGGGSVTAGKQTSKSQDESLTHVNSQVELNQVTGAINKLNIQGGEVSIADRGNLQVKEIHVESLQDTASGTSKSKGGSMGAGFGSSGLSNVTASYNQAKGQNDKAWVNETSKLLIGNAQNDADLDAMGVQKVSNIGGVIANATKNQEGTLTDHGKLNYTGALELKDIQDHSSESNRGFNVSTNVGTSIKGESKESSFHPSGSTAVGLQSTGNEKEQLTKATMGQGTVINATDSTNRDINNTQEITRDQTTGMLDGSVTIDHRLLTEDGRKQIIQEQKDLPENFRQSAENLAQALPDGEYKDKVLQTLNNVQAKLYNLPAEYKEAGELGNSVATELIKRGVEPEQISKLFSDTGFINSTYNLNKINDQLKILANEGLSLTQILNTKVSDVSENVVLAKGQDLEIEVKYTDRLGMTLLENVAKLGNDLKAISEATGVDPQTVQLAIGLLLAGPIRLTGQLIQSAAVDSVAGEYIAQGKDYLADTLTAAAHNTSPDTIRDWTNPSKVEKVYQSGLDDDIDFADQLTRNKQGAGYLIDAAAGIIGIGVGKGIAKGKESEFEINQKQSLDVGWVDNYGNQKKVTGDGTVARDHQPSKAALLKRAEDLKGEPLTQAEKNRIINEGMSVTVPNEVHVAGPTYAGKNNKELIEKDANDLQTAQIRDSKAMIENAKELAPEHVTKLQEACTALSCKNNADYDKFLKNILDEEAKKNDK
ncbi:filamentous hemagglutinin N-terminal domain-containing protein [Acinetobacter sp. WCHAc060033]|nr:hemagglutinin repeat-containing protein [Acinetobacter sp. WCHAc060033]RZG78532.1 filamentous hemagglutinin N-terminal domain-containing protein [Acinetobacter sp. WCHAc060033]